MNVGQLLQDFYRLRSAGEALALATVTRAEGSTYSKPGTRILFTAGGEAMGLLSGGCLEGDLGQRAIAVVKDQRPELVVYDMRDQDQDLLWGLGLGCNGLMEILLQPLVPDNEYAPLSALAAAIERREGKTCVQVVGSNSPQGGLGDMRLCNTAPEPSPDLLILSVPRIPRLLLLGTGPDAIPVARLARQMGWQLVAADHRPSYVANFSDQSPFSAQLVVPGEALTALQIASVDGVLIMSHHLETDLAYLRALAESDVAWIGLLGPRDRRERLLADLGEDAASLKHRLSGPVGLDLGGRGPDSIALSIAAEFERVVHGRAGHPN